MTGGGLGIAHLADIEPIELDGAGDLYAATDLKLDRRVAVRVLPALADEAARSRFNHRSRVLGLLSAHPNIVTVYDAGFTERGRPFLVMELLEGTNLVDHLDTHGPLPWSEAVDVTLQICAGLAGAQRAGAVHGDLSPEAIFLSGPSVKLGDLGLLSIGIGDRAESDPGHLLHRAPEAVDGRCDERSDLYSVASILYQLIDGRPPFWRPDDSVGALRDRLTSQPVPPLDPDLVPQQIRSFVTAALSKDPIDRPQSADEFARELDLIRRGRTTGSTPSVLHGATVAMSALPAPPPGERAVPIEPTVPAMRERVAVDAPLADPPATAPVPAGLSVPVVASAPMVSGSRISISSPATSPVPAGQATPAPPSELWAPPTSTMAELRTPVPVDQGRASLRMQPAADRTAIHQAVAAPALDGRSTWPPLPAAPSGAPARAPEPLQASSPVGRGAPMVDGDGPLRRSPFGAERSPAFLGAMAMIAVGLIGLVGLAAFGLLRSEDGDDTAAPVLPGGEPTVNGDGAEPGSSTTLTPLAMLPSSTTTTIVSDADMMSTTTTLPRVTVPNLVGMAVGNAGAMLSDAGFEVLVVGRVSPGAVPGTVTQQVPAAGSVATLPLTVTLYIPRSSSMPAVVGRPAETVCLQLTALGLQCEQTLQFDDRVAAGSVISSDPVEGAGFSDGDTVRLQVSRGPRVEVAVPEVGRRAEAEAREILGEAGFLTIAILAQPSDSVPAGQTIGTTPTVGTRIPIDEPVTILVSSGPAPRVEVPEIVGTDRATAEARLAQAGLTAAFVTTDLPDGAPEIGRVVAVDPGQGTDVPAGSSVTVTIGQQAAATATTAG